MKHQKVINYEINGNVCEFRNNDFSDVTLVAGDIITVTWTLSFDGEQVNAKPQKRVGVIKPTDWYKTIKPAFVYENLFKEKS